MKMNERPIGNLFNGILAEALRAVIDVWRQTHNPHLILAALRLFCVRWALVLGRRAIWPLIAFGYSERALLA